jgi:TrmH family RNA methyltransferase
MELRVVLVDPENPLNVGFVARAMHAFGVEDLVVVSSSWKSMPAQAHITGTSAPDVLGGARLMDDLSAALRGCATAVAFSRRPTALRQEEFTLPAMPRALNAKGRVALVFGRESAGLTRAESALCPHLARIPCRNGVSLNLGQAVAVALFSLTAPVPERSPENKAPSLDRMLALWDYVQPRLAASAKFTEARQRRIRQMFYRLRLDETDFDLLFFVMKGLAR